VKKSFMMFGVPSLLVFVSLLGTSAASSEESSTTCGFTCKALTTLFCVYIAYKVLRSFFASKWDPKGKGIVITGASSGIGEDLAYSYSRLGARLVLCARREDELKAVAEKCKKLGAASVDYVLADVAEEADCSKLIAFAISKLDGVIDCLILNAGVSMGCNFEDVKDISIFRKLMDVNYFGCINTTHFALPYLKKSKKGIIVVISSLAGKFGVPERTGYCGSKFALHGFYESLRIELAKYGIQVTLICPGIVQTNINNTRLGPNPSNWDIKKAMPIEECSRIITSAVASGKPEEVFTAAGKAAQYIRFFWPELYGKLVKIKQERDK